MVRVRLEPRLFGAGAFSVDYEIRWCERGVDTCLELIIAIAAHETEGSFLTGFYGGLVVGVDTEHAPGVGGHDLPQLDELTDVRGVEGCIVMV